ncbi:spectinomycin phosphotransferase [Friedmanniella luteola]|uniref:Spectinomycin phosphotransferase n=1 Tax=Friedmanniella luteola TaxID=546871 RepID=A0A1H1SQS9_9ACTN|nr:phosphotransferase [Friedmanniella luteola]SDS50188.1 spectinomycin phosphotransferase [Friedmanniella luteola]
MRERPRDVADEVVLDAVRRHWAGTAEAVEHLPVGFGAHHWAVWTAGVRTHFATLDAVGARHSATSLEAAYRTAVTLAAELELVVAPLTSRSGACTVPLSPVPLGRYALSLTPWSSARTPEVLDGPATAALLGRLHAVDPPPTTPRWRPRVPPDLAVRLTAACAAPWTSGPHGEEARAAIGARLEAVGRWTARYHALGATAAGRRWVVTHGEPHEANQLVDDRGRLRLVDWESVALAPAERDLRTLLERGHPVAVEPAMVELFDLEWRLDEIAQYAAWFAAPHPGSASDAVALEDLHHELGRPDAV